MNDLTDGSALWIISNYSTHKTHSYQKSTHFPFISQSPYLVGSGPFGVNPNSASISLPLAVVAFTSS